MRFYIPLVLVMLFLQCAQAAQPNAAIPPAGQSAAEEGLPGHRPAQEIAAPATVDTEAAPASPSQPQAAETSTASTPAAGASPPADTNTSPTTNALASATAKPPAEPGGQQPIALHPPGHFGGAPGLRDPASLLQPEPPAVPAPLAPATPLNLLQSQVAPGTATRLAWSPEDSFSGIASATPVLVVHGAKPGPRVCLAAAIHGDEVNGIEVVRHILYGIDPNLLSGSVIGVPIVNMQGFRRGSRYLSDRRDLNRYFPGHAKGSAAARLAASFFNEIVVHCNYLVDIHTGSLARTNLPQLRADLTKPSAVALAKSLGNIAVLHNKGAKGSLRRAALDRGIPAVTLEAGEPNTFQESAITQSVTSIEQLLNQLSMYTFSDLKPRRTDAGFYRAQWVRATGGGMLFSRVNLGQEVKAGDLLGAVTDPITNQGFKVVAPRDGLIIGMALNQVIQPGFAIYHLGFPVSIQEAASSDAGPEDFGAEPAGEGEAY